MSGAALASDTSVEPVALDALGRRLIDRFQDGLPLTERPYAAMGEAVDADEDRVLSTLHRLADQRELPLGTVAYELLGQSLARHRK